MQAINQSKYQHLVDGLLHLEILLDREFNQGTNRQQAAQFQQKLGVVHKKYDKKVAELITDYHELFSKTKRQFLSPKLKKLRKHMSQDKPVFPLLAENIRLIYGT